MTRLRFVTQEINIKAIFHLVIECIITTTGMLVVEFTTLIIR